MSDAWRCFIAVPLDDVIVSALSASVAAWRRDAPDGLRWADPDGWHLTLAFLGDVDADRVPEIAETVRATAAAHGPTAVPTARLGAFPRPSSARVLWYGVADADGLLARLADALAANLELPTAEPFRAHITLARARRRHADLRGWIERASASAPEALLPVTSLDLIRSHLGRGPARYERLATAALGVPARV